MVDQRPVEAASVKGMAQPGEGQQKKLATLADTARVGQAARTPSAAPVK